MFMRIIDHLVPPVFADDEEKSRKAYLLNVITISSFLGSLLYSLIVPEERRLYGMLAIGVNLIVWLVTRRGYIRTASITLVAGISCVVALVVIASGGVKAPEYNTFIVPILFAGLLLGWKATVSLTILCVLFGAVLLQADLLSLLPETSPYSPAVSWVIDSIIFVLAGGFLTMALRLINDGLRRANKELAERKQAEATLRKSEERYRNIFDNVPASIWEEDFSQVKGYLDELRANGVDDLRSYFDDHPDELSKAVGMVKVLNVNDRTLELFEAQNKDELLRSLDKVFIPESVSVFRDELVALAQGKSRFKADANLQTLSGVPLNVVIKISFPANSISFEHVLVSIMDITGRKRVEDALRESETRYHHILDTMREGCQIIDFDWRYLYVNEVVTTQQALLKREEMLNHTILELYPGVEHTELFAVLRRCMEGRVPAQVETEFIFPDGRSGWFELSIQPAIEGIFILSTDISERRQAHAALHRSERAYANILKNITGAVYRCRNDKDWTVEYISEGCMAVTGYRPEEIIESRVTSLGALMHPEDVEPIWEKCQVNLAARKACDNEYRIFHRNGGMYWVRDQAQGVYSEAGELIYIEGLITDITGHKQTEEQLRYQATLLMNVNDAVIASDDKFVLTSWNRRAEQIYGWSADEAVGQAGEVLLKSEFTGKTRAQVIEELQETGQFFTEVIHTHKDGTRIYVEARSTALRDANGRIMGYVSVNRDITERKRSEEKIQRQNQRLKVLREIDTAILSADTVENIVSAALTHIRSLTDCRRAHMSLFNWETNEALIVSLSMFGETSIPNGTRVPLAPFQSLMQALSQDQLVLMDDLTGLPDPPTLFQNAIKEGFRSVCILPLFSQSNLIGTFNMSSEIPNFFDEEKINLGREVANQVAIAITQNRLIGELRRLNADLEEHGWEREKLIAELTAKNAELERFTYTVSHDLRSPLVTMKGFLGYLEQDAMTGNVERLKGDTKRIANAVEKMQELLSDLLELSRIGRFVNPPALVPFGEIVQEVLELVPSQIKAASVTVQIQPGLPAVYGDRQRLIEVLQNLLDNAAKYMGDQPEPLIEIGQRGEEEGRPIFFVRDNGIGIAPEYGERVFGLFNKLDARSEGTGIGLALVRRIIEFHGGRIWVESEEGRGATFYFTLPGAPFIS